MKTRRFGKTGRMVSEIGLGTWQLGTKWGDPFNGEEARRILEASYDQGITLIDTADIYNGGSSEEAIGAFIKKHPGHFYIVTKCGRGLNPHTAKGYRPEAMEAFIDGSLKRLGVEAAKELKKLFGTENLVPYALRWVLMFEEVSTVIPGASKTEQVLSNAAASDFPLLTREQMEGVERIYNTYIRESVHGNW